MDAVPSPPPPEAMEGVLELRAGLRKDFKSGSDRVFNTTELLEQILVHVGTPLSHEIKDGVGCLRCLLQAQRVSRQFKSVIDGSSILRKMLFFEADDECTPVRINPLFVAKEEEPTSQREHNEKSKRNQKLRSFFGSADGEWAWQLPAGQGPWVEGSGLPCIAEAYLHIDDTPCLILTASKCCYSHKDELFFDGTCECSRKPEAGSWKRMLLSQPPKPFKLGVRDGRSAFRMRGEIDGTKPLSVALGDAERTLVENAWVGRREKR